MQNYPKYKNKSCIIQQLGGIYPKYGNKSSIIQQ